jgi:predicted Zn-dependent protease
MNRLYAWFLISLVSFFTTSCVVNPANGGANIILISGEKEKEIGLEVHENLILSQPVLNNESLQAYVERVGNDIADLSHRPDLNYTFTILDSDVVNASAAPGGYVYINRGLLALLNSEAELAAVLAHEIAHITARHGVQQLSRAKIANATSFGAAVATTVATGGFVNGAQISQITSIWAQSALSGFGRDLELEADSLAAEYIANAGYDPAAMIHLITALKNQADFNRKIAGKGGGYHGLFATHPRNDKRLQEAIEDAAALSSKAITRTDNTEFRAALDGLVFGQSTQSQRNDERNRYYQSLLGYTLVFPPEWTVEETTTTATGSLDGAGTLRIEAQQLQDNLDPRLFIKEKLGIENLQQSEPLEQFRLVGHTGLLQTAEGTRERIAVIYLGRRAMIFRGQATSDDVDAEILASIRSFRAIQRGEGAGVEAKIRFVQASEFFDFKVVGQQSRIANYPEETLRLLNNYYPTGTPAAGTWIKLVE